MADDFTKLNVWVESSNLVNKIYKLTVTFPEIEKYALVSQVRRSANSVPANMAESCGRYFDKDKVRVLYQARGELEETRSHLIIAHKLGYCTKDQADELDQAYVELRRQLNSFIRSLS